MTIIFIILAILALPMILVILYVVYHLICDACEWLYEKYMYYVRGLEKHKYYDISSSNSLLGDFLCYLSGPSKITWEPIKKDKKK